MFSKSCGSGMSEIDNILLDLVQWDHTEMLGALKLALLNSGRLGYFFQ